MSVTDILIKKVEELTRAVNSIRSSSKKIHELPDVSGEQIFVAASNGSQTGKVLLPSLESTPEEIDTYNLLITSEFQNLINNLSEINLIHSKCILRGKTLGVSICFQNIGNSDIQLFGDSESIFVMFAIPNPVLARLNSEIAILFPQYKLNSTDPISNYSSYQTFFETTGVIKHPYGLTLSRDSFTTIYGEFNCLNE